MQEDDFKEQMERFNEVGRYISEEIFKKLWDEFKGMSKWNFKRGVDYFLSKPGEVPGVDDFKEFFFTGPRIDSERPRGCSKCDYSGRITDEVDTGQAEPLSGKPLMQRWAFRCDCPLGRIHVGYQLHKSFRF